MKNHLQLNKAFLLCLLFSLVTRQVAWSQQGSKKSFEIIPLGVKGGLEERNLSAYLVAAAGTEDYVSLDAGTIRSGLEKAFEKKAIRENAEKFMRQHIKGYLISHGHLDHIAGLVLNSPNDTSKYIYAMPAVTDVLSKYYFTWQSWANFTNEGEAPQLNKYQYTHLREGIETPLANTGLSVKAFPLSHVNPYQSTAFLIQNSNSQLLYLGDTGADSVEHSQELLSLWNSITPLIRQRTLKAIFIEVSYPNEQPDKLLFGHLTPKWLMLEMNRLALLCGKENLQSLKICITHIKPGDHAEKKISEQLHTLNDLKLSFIFPEQGEKLVF